MTDGMRYAQCMDEKLDLIFEHTMSTINMKFGGFFFFFAFVCVGLFFYFRLLNRCLTAESALSLVKRDER